jgi:hypothetical protein
MTTGERRRSPPRAFATSASSWLQPVASMCTLYGLMRRVQGQRDSPLSPPCEPRRSWSRGRAPSYGGTVLAGVNTLHSFVELIPAFRPCPYVDLRLCAQKTAGTLLELRLRLSPQGPAWAKEREGSVGILQRGGQRLSALDFDDGVAIGSPCRSCMRRPSIFREFGQVHVF